MIYSVQVKSFVKVVLLLSFVSGNASSFNNIKNFAQCKYHLINDMLIRNLSNLTTDANFVMLNNINQISNRSLKTRSDLASPHLLYRYALFNGYTYCNSSANIPSDGVIPKIMTELPTGKFDLYRDPNHPLPEYQITTNHDQRTIVFAWRGSLTRQDYRFDLDGDLRGETHSTFLKFNSYGNETSRCKLSQEAKVFKGFLRSMPSDVENLANLLIEIKSMHPDYSLIIVGHSLGGAKAILFAYYLSNFLSEALPITAVYTFGQPIIGTKALANEMTNCIGKGKIIRAVSERDSIVWLRRQKNEIDHPDGVRIVYSPKHSSSHYETCYSPNDPKCGAGLTCFDLTADYHGWFAGLYFSGSHICNE